MRRFFVVRGDIAGKDGTGGVEEARRFLGVGGVVDVDDGRLRGLRIFNVWLGDASSFASSFAARRENEGEDEDEGK